jgi:hypothetical protein
MTRSVELKVTEIAAIHARADNVRSFVTDLKNLRFWDASIQGVRLVRAGDSSKGAPAVYEVSIDFAPFGGCCLGICLPTSGATKLLYEVFGGSPVVMRGVGSGVRTRETYTFRSVGPKTTELTYVVCVELTGWRTLFAACIERRTRYLSQSAMRRLRRLW